MDPQSNLVKFQQIFSHLKEFEIDKRTLQDEVFSSSLLSLSLSDGLIKVEVENKSLWCTVESLCETLLDTLTDLKSQLDCHMQKNLDVPTMLSTTNMDIAQLKLQMINLQLSDINQLRRKQS